MGSVSRVSVKRSLSHVLNVVHTLSKLKPKFNNAETKKPFHEFSFKPSSNFFLCVGYFSRKNIVFVFATFIKFSCKKWSFFLAHAQDIVGYYCHLIFVVYVFDRK